MKINIQHLKNKFVVEIDDLDITIEELKKKLEGVMTEPVKIPATDQALIFEREKMDDGKKLADYVKSTKDEIKLFVIKQQRNANPISKPVASSGHESNNQVNSTPNPYLSSNQPMNNPYAMYGQMPYGYGSPQPMYGQMPYGYGSPQPMYGQMPYGYGSPQPMYGQMPYGYGSPQGDGYNNEAFSNAMMQQMEQMLNNPALLDQVLSIQNPNMTPEQKEDHKKLLKDALNMMKSNPGLFQQAFTPENVNMAMNSMNMMGQGGMYPPYPPAPMGGYDPRHPNARIAWKYGGYQSPMYGGARPEQQPQQFDEQAYLISLEQLKSMGFEENEAMDALKKAKGDINRALDILHDERRKNSQSNGSYSKK
ncbi:hypothetical protein HK407_02g03470 [Ordospora pajunii]|uniref:uncharacterized protein n=1 Tax=Ordospora pajunii TaxID=3039483 RepID=UPI0029528166|nr:uncharacterized protein HK407_02g03470 [Ordospora pajunii]KAH9411902.1 hypothetical protein HK407_02g03470 [Ordospora pajunii]